ncbi:ABC1 kinase family protein [Umezakia ovalisporum]|jgi:predicted unusual protein kinase regulating ubiquinone biosynthesis (AarF/ABC1/UbiB family)|uniref:AarF/ABC1/UbiB kinase family protein n=2 Tax=Umezakia ovalisporum TaxID=75695 RepID=A0AA43KGK7_9CYAN|nr:AarF/ABC1/UbiB kinase family protein [Umezakia ovalisporum]MBI1242252.1 AarF/ABC1/UbiB kinase family protein [Nostoc sp. RI_552]MDH6057090.1 AarF/ABC1/UbiB kinase family protein [Umezakia ovalisporum FSS-43]MDH6065038.1 AarF/ABC1/UbiB kinase family protein [Umezakia ovalisporum FSS-62]MDH6067179.1 AarF/ABC1/UbiB kinase family protein [Umezakia ovalisporum APH033B]MDH6071403.1 AarF/ABC1/UbiB kinase family protein [Umezakia ovalisporum CobakiLakeA]
MFLTQTVPRQREIIEVVFRHGWDYMRRLLTGGKTDEPQLPTPAVLKNILVDLGPVYVKLGQLLSTRPDLLNATYIEELSTLQNEVPPVPWTEVEVIIRKQLKRPLEETFSTVNPVPVAAGSIAQTHRATLVDGKEVALKVQRPGIELTVPQDIALILGIADLVARTDFGQTYEIKSIAKEFTKALEDELDFTLEASFTDELRGNLSRSRWFDPKQLVVAEIFWNLTTEKLLVMEWLDGVPLLAANLNNLQKGKDPHTQRQEITTLLFRAFFQQLYIDGFFHADPHPGNLFYLVDGRIGLLDCGMVGRLDPRTQQILTEMLLAIIDLDAGRCAQLTLQLAGSSQPVILSRLENDYDRMLRKYHNVSLTEINFSQVIYEILQVARNNKIPLPSNMGLYAKTLANLEGVARAFNPQVNLFEEIQPLITDLFRRQLLGENPVRSLLRTALDIKSLSLQSPRQIELLLDRVTSETLQWNLSLNGLDGMRRTMDDAANRLSFSILVGSLIMGAAIISTKTQTTQLSVLSSVLFAAASLLGLWLVISILRSGRLK